MEKIESRIFILIFPINTINAIKEHDRLNIPITKYILLYVEFALESGDPFLVRDKTLCAAITEVILDHWPAPILSSLNTVKNFFKIF